MTYLDLYKTDPQIRRDIIEDGIIITTVDDRDILSFYLTDQVERPSWYTNFAQLSSELTENDIIEIILVTPGGYFDGGNLIISAMNASPAQVVGVILGEVASMGTLIALKCDQLIIEPQAEFMIHNPSYGYSGKHQEVEAHVTFTTKQQKKMMQDSYKYFLTKKEIKRVLRGGDIWLDASEISARWDNVLAERKKLADAEQAEQLVLTIDAYKEGIASLEAQLKALQK
jgi:ATP-dependent protease ClpP protease subunit